MRSLEQWRDKSFFNGREPFISLDSKLVFTCGEVCDLQHTELRVCLSTTLSVSYECIYICEAIKRVIYN